MASDNVANIANYSKYKASFSFNLIRVLISMLFLVACIILVIVGYLLFSHNAYISNNVTGYIIYDKSSPHPTVIQVTNLFLYVSGIGLVVSGLTCLFIIFYLWNLNNLEYVNCYEDKKNYLADPSRRGIFLSIKRMGFSIVDHIDNKAICGLLLTTISGITLTIIIGVCIAFVFAMINNIYTMIAGIILIPVILAILIFYALVNAESGKQYIQDKDNIKINK